MPEANQQNHQSPIVKHVRAARRVSAPLLAINTADPAATVREIVAAAGEATPIVQWDLCTGTHGVNEAGVTAATTAMSGGFDDTVQNPIAAAQLVGRLPERSLAFLHNAHRFLADIPFVQAVWNLRDALKRDGRTLVMLGTEFKLPPELAQDVLVFDEPLPDEKQLAGIVQEQHDNAGLACDEAVLSRAVEAVQGLSAFSAEQVTAMSLRPNGLDLASLWDRKRQVIEATPGLKVFRGGDSFDDIGGVAVVKQFLSSLMAGRGRPNAVVFVDEIEKAMAGTAGDTSGVSQDQLGVLLSYMQDHSAAGVIFIGPPGSAKSAIAKAAGNSAGVPTIQLDMGAMKGSLVGQSEQQLRSALKVVTSVSNGKSLWIATCNKIHSLPPELRRRFTLGVFYFDLPTAAERHAIWSIWGERYQAEASNPGVADDGWTGAEIRQCCEIAWRLGCTLEEASRYIVPVSRQAPDEIQALRTLANGRFLSASTVGVYRLGQGEQQPANVAPARRMIAVE